MKKRFWARNYVDDTAKANLSKKVAASQLMIADWGERDGWIFLAETGKERAYRVN